MKRESIRQRLQQAIAGEPVQKPVFAVYDWFVRNRPLDWNALFQQGLGQINHADVIRYRRPHLEIIESTREVEGQIRRDVRWITDIGELHEWYLGEWRQAYLIKNEHDYRLMARAWQDAVIELCDDAFDASEDAVSTGGITVAQLDRTPFQVIQIDYAGLERFSYDIADQIPGLMDLLELMNEVKLEEFRAVRHSAATQIKLWENLSIETMGPVAYRRYLVPLYEKIFAILEGSDKKLQVHYDGKMRIIAEDIKRLPFDGIDSLTPLPEGDLSVAEARALWPDKFLWLHPSLSLYDLPPKALIQAVQNMARDAGANRYCLMISEEAPSNWETTVPLVLEALDNLN
ncbi:MAG: hypothetical protein GY759_09210 [Chloroflexi bacterium]|nr:hypothetical protein [Chloroflexota bacterium]